MRSLLEDGLSYNESIVVRSYEVGINETSTVENIAMSDLDLGTETEILCLICLTEATAMLAKKDVAWGKRTRVILEVGYGVASFGGYLFDKDVLTLSFAPKDEHEAQVQFALERGIPAISAVMGTKRLPFPSRVFDVVHCARRGVPWHIEDGKLLLELNSVAAWGFFVWSATPVYQKLQEDVEIWGAMSALTRSMCWKLVNKVKERINSKGIAIFQKPMDNRCYDARSATADPPLCGEYDNPDAAC